MLKISRADFVAGAATLADLPATLGKELAFVGRSNVGKSSLINRLCNQSKLARTSATPGRTQQINLFDAVYSQGGKERHLSLVDLPGFGFAKLGHEQRESLYQLIVAYIREREALSVVCILNDCRRDPERDELAVRDLAFETGRHVVVLLTKADKLKDREVPARTKDIAAKYGLQAEDVLVTGDRIPITPLLSRLVTLCAVVD